MTNSRIGFNVHATSQNFDKNKLYAHIQKTHPAWMLVMDGLQVARDIKALIPECNVIHRAWPDEEIWKQQSPAEWVANKKREIGDADVWCYTVNEMGLSDNLANWFTGVIEAAAAVHLKVVIGNCSVGTPAPEQWRSPAVIKMLQALDKHRDIAVLALHEYFILVPASGVLGGYPDNAGVKPGEHGGINLVPAANWPSADHMKTFTCFHCGRFKFMIESCVANGIKPPRLVLTEHGPDDVSDLKAWAEQQPKTPPYTGIRGWKSCVEAWKKFYPQWTAEQTLFETIKWLDTALYQGTCVEGQLIFSWGYSSDMWQQFDTSQALEFQHLLETYATAALPPVTQPPPVPFPPKPPAPPTPPPETLPTAEVVAFRQLIQLDAEAKLLVDTIKAREDANEADEKQLDVITGKMQEIIEKWRKTA